MVLASNSPNLWVWLIWNWASIWAANELSSILAQVSIADDLNGFPHLKRLYYRGNYYNWRSLSREERNILTSHARALADAVLGLESITLLGNPFWTARIKRRKSGEVTGVELGQRCGMQIGHDDEAFPCLPYNGSDSLWGSCTNLCFPNKCIYTQYSTNSTLCTYLLRAKISF